MGMTSDKCEPLKKSNSSGHTQVTQCGSLCCVIVCRQRSRFVAGKRVRAQFISSDWRRREGGSGGGGGGQEVARVSFCVYIKLERFLRRVAIVRCDEQQV